jgi:hypothetical protein
MYGVVLWSDAQDKKAVIWCEDHGDLAFYSGKDDSAFLGAPMDAGDLVQFDLRQERHMRLASNPRLVAEDQYPTLAHELKMVDAVAETREKDNSAPALNDQVEPSDAKIIPFDIARRAMLRDRDAIQEAV